MRSPLVTGTLGMVRPFYRVPYLYFLNISLYNKLFQPAWNLSINFFIYYCCFINTTFTICLPYLNVVSG